ncbi:hypothetical protein DL897_09050 [Thermoflavimicrobium daqui]|jgi:hypothetical protein|uniref:Uncharacterized protein n=1 Tax=Thermoflavimicrobium daqui TaxID=2137476 RepID=A0A364K507_9BACL|nr:hypothetical protein DL897_09050 [Thermoflavimicrobium daqui]
MKKTLMITNLLILVIGVIHCFSTPLFYSHYNLDSVWFLISGCFLILLSFINYLLVSLKDKERLLFWLADIANTIAVIVCTMLILVEAEAQIIFLSIILWLNAICVWKYHYKFRRKQD